MSEVPEGPGWWEASDLKWYPPDQRPNYEAPPPSSSEPPTPPEQPPGGPSPVPPPQPADGPPPQIGTPQSRPARSIATPWIIAGVLAAVVVLAVGGITGYLLRRPSTTSQPSTTPSTAPPIAEGALDGLLLSPDQINTAMGATRTTVTRSWNTLNDVAFGNPTSPPECNPIDGAAEAAAYVGSGWTAVRGQTLQDHPPQYTLSVEQGVVLFPSAQAATAFVSASTQSWPGCANRSYTDNVNNTQWSSGPVSTTNGTLSAAKTMQGADTNGWACQRALTARNNVVIDASACIHNNTTEQGVFIADQIAAKIPTT